MWEVTNDQQTARLTNYVCNCLLHVSFPGEFGHLHETEEKAIVKVLFGFTFVDNDWPVYLKQVSKAKAQ